MKKILLLGILLTISTVIVAVYAYVNIGTTTGTCVEAPLHPSDLELFSPPTLLSIGDKAPEIDSPDVYGNNFSLSSLQGKTIVINFMGTWCQSCIWEIGDLIDIHNNYSDQNIMFLSIAIEANGIVQDVIDFKSKYCADWTFILDEDNIFSSYEVELLPTTFVIDGSGVIMFSRVGLIDPNELSNVLKGIF